MKMFAFPYDVFCVNENGRHGVLRQRQAEQ
jgi:hypothetical protein